MAVLIPGSAYRALFGGQKVADEPAAVLPATATRAIFIVTGGRVLVAALVGNVTTATDATATTLSVGTVPTVGTAAAAGLASAVAITSREIGTMFGLPALAGGALIVGANAGAPVQVPGHNPYVVPAGTITITTSATNAGATSWSLLYVPLDDGASVAAA